MKYSNHQILEIIDNRYIQQMAGNKNIVIISTGLGIWLAAIVILQFHPSDTFMDENLHFHTYCPISYDKDHKLVKHLVKSDTGLFVSATDARLKALRHQAANQIIGSDNSQLNNTYVIYAKVRYSSHSSFFHALQFQLAYCSLAARWGQSCEDVDDSNYICSSPGPTFMVKTKQAIDVIWVNDISVAQSHQMNTLLFDGSGNFYFQNVSNPHYVLKTKSTSDVENSCTFTNPTQSLLNHPNSRQMNWDGVPMSPHIRGLEVRPTFNGHPTSWFLNDGTKGLSFMSMGLNDQYYNSGIFPEKISYKDTLVALEEGSPNVKYNRYLNDQPAGHFQYVDNTYSCMEVNVRVGLVGAYIIYDEAIEAQLNKVSVLELIQLTNFYLAPQNDSPRPESLQSNSVISWTSIYDQQFDREILYRIAIHNVHFLDKNTFFFYYNEIDSQNNITQIKIPVTILAKDSTFLENFIPNVLDWDLHSSERIQLFLDLSRIPVSINNFSLHFHGVEDTVQVVLDLDNTFQLKPIANPNKTIKHPLVPLRIDGAPKFISLVKVAPTLMRFRVVDRFYTGFPGVYLYYINGHDDFMIGQFQTPQIGTTEDWFLIGLSPVQEEPIHVHLVSFQVIEKFTLKNYRAGCTFYALNFYRNVDYKNINASQLDSLMNDNDAMCDFIQTSIKNRLHMPELRAANKQSEIHSQPLDSIDQAYKPNRVVKASGQYLFKRIRNDQKAQFAPSYTQGCDPKFSMYPYICNTIQVSELQKKWTDIALTPYEGVARIRIRWASTDYPLNDKICTQKKNNKTGKVQSVCRENNQLSYFKTSEIALSEYPGFVYQSTELYNTDTGMMRPFMLQFSERFKRSKPEYKNWRNWTDVIKSHKRFNCLNKFDHQHHLPSP